LSKLIIYRVGLHSITPNGLRVCAVAD